MSATGKPLAQGFTLIEALVVVAITALLGGLMFPRLQGLVTGQEFRTARSTVILGVEQARARAIRSGGDARFAVATDGRGFQLDARRSVALPASVRLAQSAGRGGLFFYADGTSSGGRLTLTGGKQREEFVIFPTTGLISAARQ